MDFKEVENHEQLKNAQILWSRVRHLEMNALQNA